MNSDTEQRRQAGTGVIQHVMAQPSPTVFGRGYQTHTLFGMLFLLRAAQYDLRLGQKHEDLLDSENFHFGCFNEDHNRLKLHLWRNLTYLGTMVNRQEKADLKCLGDVIYGPDMSSVSLRKHLMRYVRASHIPCSRIRVPFDFERFVELCGYDGADDVVNDDELRSNHYRPSPHAFKVFGFTFGQHTGRGISLLTQAARLSIPQNEKNKPTIWLRLLRLEKRMDSASKQDLARLAALYYGSETNALESRVLVRKQVLSFVDSLSPVIQASRGRQGYFRISEFELHRGYEGEDDNVNEIGILVPRDCPSAEYRPRPTCNVCMDEYPLNRYPQSKITSKCDHESSVCLDCLQESIRAQLPDTLTCPLCLNIMDYEDVKRWSNPEVFQRYTEIILRQKLEADPTFNYCLSGDCSNGQLHFGNHPEMKCLECSFKTCIRHNLPWHEGETCEEFDMRNTSLAENNRLSLEYIDKTTKACPKCKVRLEKSYGCDHFTCGRDGCGHEFCWLCLAPWKKVLAKGWKAHGEECPYHTKRLPNEAPLNPVFYLQEGNTGQFPQV